MKRYGLKLLVSSMVACLLAVGLQIQVAQAAMVDNEHLSHSLQVERQRDGLKTLLARDDVRSRLTELGVDPRRAAERVDSMTAREVAAIHASIDDLPAGSGALGLIVVVLVIFIITDAVGATDIFPGV